MRLVAAPRSARRQVDALHPLGPDWKAARALPTSIWSHSRRGGSTRQMTFTKDKNETAPRGRGTDVLRFRFEPRSAASAARRQNQLYLMRPDGGEARKITEAKDGVGAFRIQPRREMAGVLCGQRRRATNLDVSVAEIESEAPSQLTKHATPVTSWHSRPTANASISSRLTLDKENKERKEKKFDVRIRNEEPPLAHLWAFDLETRRKRAYFGADYSVSDSRSRTTRNGSAFAARRMTVMSEP